MSKRERLVEELEKLRWEQAQRIFLGQTPGFVEEIADFILADRKRIVEPLVKWREEMNIINNWPDPSDPIEETLKRSGVEL